MRQDRVLRAGEPRAGVRAERDGHAVEPGERAEYGARVHVVGEEAGGRGEDARGEVADGELPQLECHEGESERGQIEADEGDAVRFEGRAGGAHPADRLRVGGGGVQHDEPAVLLQ